MSWRIVCVSSRSKLDVYMNCLVIRGDTINKIHLDEIGVLMIENPMVSFTGCLIEALVNKKIKVVFCDSTHSPIAELIPHHGSSDSYKKMTMQMQWDDSVKGIIWKEIICEKIRNQSVLLRELGKEDAADFIYDYVEHVENYDASNREGHAAKVYFNALFGKNFTRTSDCTINMALNYGYSCLNAAFNREVTAHGYLTQLGLFHHNPFNHFNFSSDLMEPFRTMIDRKVYSMDLTEFGKNEKHEILDILNQYVVINQTKQTLLNAIGIYTMSVIEAINEYDVSKILFYRLINEL